MVTRRVTESGGLIDPPDRDVTRYLPAIRYRDVTRTVTRYLGASPPTDSPISFTGAIAKHSQARNSDRGSNGKSRRKPPFCRQGIARNAVYPQGACGTAVSAYRLPVMPIRSQRRELNFRKTLFMAAKPAELRGWEGACTPWKSAQTDTGDAVGLS